MRSTFHGLEVAKRGLFAQQTGINTTAHNIANANTKGYSRQRVNFTTTLPMEMPAMNRSVAPGQLGTGVDFSSIVRLRETFLDNQYRKESTTLGYWTVQKDTLEKIELIFNEPSEDGLRTTIDQFFNAWSDLSREPDNTTARAVVVERAQAMLDAFQHVHTKLLELQEDLQESFNVKLNQANVLLSQIADLNKQIRRIEGMGMNANDLRDQRDLLVDELSRLIPIDVDEDPQGMYNIRLLHNGTSEINLVTGIDYKAIGTADSPNAAYWAITGKGMGGELHSLYMAFDGTVSGIKNGIIPQYIEQVENMFFALVEKVNEIHRKGYSLEPQDGPPSDNGMGINFFDYDNLSINSVTINHEIIEDFRRIAASSSYYEYEEDNNQKKYVGYPGNGEIALEISQLRYTKIDSVTIDTTTITINGTIDEYYRSILGALGVQTQEAQRQTNNAQLILDSVEFRRQSVSGVSLDEEMANLVQLQHAYNASARMITTVDQALDTIINRMGIVGR